MQRRLLIITDEMEVGGTQRQIVELARHIDRSAFHVTVVYFRNGSPYVNELRDAGVEVTCIPKRWKLDPGFFLRLCRFIRSGEFDLVHGFSFIGEFWGWLANLVAGRGRFIGSARSVYDWFSPLQWNIKRLVTLNSAALIANSRAGAEYAALQMGVRQSSVQVVYNGMRIPPVFEQRTERARTPGDACRVLFVGRLVTHKNIPCLLRAFALVARAIPAAQLDIVGDGPLRAAMQSLCDELGLASKVTFHGEQTDVVPFLLHADAFVCSSHREGLSNAIMEAMSAGVAVVASNVGGNSELVSHLDTGLLFPADDHESLAAMLCDLARDPALRERIGRAGQESIRRLHDPRRMAAEMESIYARCLLEESACAVER